MQSELPDSGSIFLDMRNRPLRKPFTVRFQADQTFLVLGHRWEDLG